MQLNSTTAGQIVVKSEGKLTVKKFGLIKIFNWGAGI